MFYVKCGKCKIMHWWICYIAKYVCFSGLGLGFCRVIVFLWGLKERYVHPSLSQTNLLPVQTFCRFWRWSPLHTTDEVDWLRPPPPRPWEVSVSVSVTVKISSRGKICVPLNFMAFLSYRTHMWYKHINRRRLNMWLAVILGHGGCGESHHNRVCLWH